ncbi:phytoene/squalene synthase family protein [Parvularcula sp. LCG005]|uniref:phytoene/squalene synthase family protein n=1 Tax=Parvularcula sp. LCG005 TaxID=3078805 RepID=UPI002941BEE9|nr:phytoene/squalene synthase family protein [Parvularcula sp. LCG005]WOI54580.1 phytoene/squalene synthase family protein [Parvularcula sp. LCG005]
MAIDQDIVAAKASEAISKGSKSFALASLLFRPRMKRHAHMLYAWCRYCDDVVDGQNLGFSTPTPDGQPHVPSASDLAYLREQTHRAMTGGTVIEPAFLALQTVTEDTGMPEKHALELLHGFEMDVADRSYETLADTLEYGYHVAGVVGVMMAIIMGVAPDDQDTLDRASDLGIAFQLTNICRDIIDDARIGRVYLPADWLREAGVEPTPEAVLDTDNREAVWTVALRLLDEADRYYRSSGPGVRRLPIRAGFAVAAARGVYRDIGRVVRKNGTAAWDERARTSRRRKLALAGLGCLQGATSKSQFFRKLPPRPALLWTRPVT